MKFSNTRIIRRLVFLIALVAPTLVCAQVLPLPPRPAGARTGSQLQAALAPLSRDAREQVILQEIATGNVPDHLRPLKPITATRTIASVSHTITYYVTPDYLALGSASDFFRMPMTPILAQTVADMTSCSLPTRRMVDAIWSAAPSKMNPQPIPPSAEMVTIPVFWTHHQMVESSRTQLGLPLGPLIAGIKKDVVISPTVRTRPAPDRVAIYGWHYTTGSPIQPLYTGHESTYADYSHGIRLVSNAVLLDGSPSTLKSVLEHPTLNELLSDEGVFVNPRYDIPAPPAGMPYVDSFPSAGRQLAGQWIDRFTTPQIMAFSPTSPGGDGYVLRVRDASGGIDTTRIGGVTNADYFVEAHLFCDTRTIVGENGFERIGIFARDSGTGMFEGISGGGIQGNNYSLTWDSNTGRVQCLRTIGGVPVDLLSTPEYRTGTGWRLFRLETVGTTLTFKMDGQTILSITDSTYTAGSGGIGYHDYLDNNANIIGTLADNFRMDAFTLSGVENWTQF